jgi:hypothetical protein
MCIKAVFVLGILMVITGCATIKSGTAYRVELHSSLGAAETISIVALVPNGAISLPPPPLSMSNEIATNYNLAAMMAGAVPNGCIVLSSNDGQSAGYLFFKELGTTFEAVLGKFILLSQWS